MTSINFLPPSWGGTNTSKDYEFLMQGATILSEPISLAGEHSIDTPTQNLTEPVLRRYVTFVKGRLVDREQVIRSADQLSLTMNVNFGQGLETPLLQRARRLLRTTMAARRVCADPRESHVYIWPDAIPNPPTRVNAPITIEDTVMAQWQSEFRTDEEYIVKEVGVFSAKTAATTPVPLYAVAFLDEECSTASGTQFSDLVAVGGDGVGSISILLSNNRFTTSFVPSSAPAPVGSIGTSVFTSGDVVLVGFSDEPRDAIATSTIGGTLFSSDGGQNFALDTNITAPIFAVGKFGSVYLAAGGVGATPGVPYMGVSTDGVNWTAVTSPAFPVTGIFVSLSVDEIEGRVYALTAAGALFVGTLNGGTLVFSPLTLPATVPASMFKVHVMAKGAIAVSGGAGYYAESLDSGATFEIKPVGAGSSAVRAIAGGPYRTVIGASNFVNDRTLLSDNTFRRVQPQNGLVNDVITDIVAVNDPRELNFYAATTVDGEVVVIRDFSPYT